MDPLSALSIASAVIQIVDFSSKVIARTREVYQSADGSIEEITLIEDATANLDDLMTELMSKTEIEASTSGAFEQKTPDQQLIQLAEDSHTLANELNQTLKACRVKKDGSQRSALSQGLRSVLEQKSLTTLKQKLDELRKQIDTTLLIAIR
jgi:ribosomal protein L17